MLLLKLGLIEALVVEYRTVLDMLLEPESDSWSSLIMRFSLFPNLIQLGGGIDERSIYILSYGGSLAKSFLLDFSDGSVVARFEIGRSKVGFLVVCDGGAKGSGSESSCLESGLHQRASGLGEVNELIRTESIGGGRETGKALKRSAVEERADSAKALELDYCFHVEECVGEEETVSLSPRSRPTFSRPCLAKNSQNTNCYNTANTPREYGR